MPNLPFELEREIFELAFRAGRRNANLKLAFCMVARRVQVWIDLIFYAMVTIRDDHRAGQFLCLVDSKLKPPAFFSAVKVLCLPSYVSAQNACRILAACPAVERLALWIDCDSDTHQEFSSLIGGLPLRRLSLELNHISRVPATPGTWLSNLTHLYIIVWAHSTLLELLPTIRRLPHLTHIALDFGFASPSAEHTAVVCSSCPSLRVLVVRVNDIRQQIEKDANDYRVVAQNWHEPIADWEAPCFGLPDVWSRAEAAIEERLKKASVGSV
ncbi:hypothetical protein B0H16DRAFT_1386223 [Mycena metata]|uniref:F-box domain-containing protein n=1 Tax=Mycena metata TaxID=1033252 RepID=A0AAD7HIF9_9AGAR|nr:hypothetical protein B0H16DRAFT_1386223 [Mycena metata]